MLLEQLTVRRFLSFDHDGVDLKLRDLNVLIGPNGSGKSNLLEVLAVIRAMPTNFGALLLLRGPLRDWRWRATQATGPCILKVTSRDPKSGSTHGHALVFNLSDDRCSIVAENIHTDALETAGPEGRVYELKDGYFTRWDVGQSPETESADSLDLAESILSQSKEPTGKYPHLRAVQDSYSGIVLHRGWVFGPQAFIRRPQKADERADRLSDGAENLPNEISRFYGGAKRDLLGRLREFMGGIESIETPVGQGMVELILDEGNGREIPASRLSDGTLRYLGLLAILLDPNPPALVAIEEPELGLHPDILPGLGKLIKEASSRMQIFITTHSQILLDAFSETPEDVIVCSRGATGSKMERLDAKKLEIWLKDHTLGELWNMGEIGGNRW